MRSQPNLITPRLTLRPFTPADAPEVERLAGDRQVAATTLRIPHPYPAGYAEAWIKPQKDDFRAGKGAIFAIVITETNQLCGAVGLAVDQENKHAELGYWVGVPFWNRGYCTEASRMVLAFAFQGMRLHKVHAAHFSHNPASGRVLQKLGMIREGLLRQHLFKWGEFVDVELYGILRSQWDDMLRRSQGA